MTTALVVDDEADARAFVRAVLESDGWEVAEAADGEEALQQARTLNPFVMILDVSMPRKNGLAVFRELMSYPDTCRIKVIMLTGVAEKFNMPLSPKDMEHFLGKSPAGFMEKPIEPARLLRLVRRVTGTDLDESTAGQSTDARPGR